MAKMSGEWQCWLCFCESKAMKRDIAEYRYRYGQVHIFSYTSWSCAKKHLVCWLTVALCWCSVHVVVALCVSLRCNGWVITLSHCGQSCFSEWWTLPFTRQVTNINIFAFLSLCLTNERDSIVEHSLEWENDRTTFTHSIDKGDKKEVRGTYQRHWSQNRRKPTWENSTQGT